jgi:hypothetical protein
VKPSGFGSLGVSIVLEKSGSRERSTATPVVYRPAARDEVPDHAQRFGFEHPLDDFNAASPELAHPIGMDGSLIEARQRFELGAAARDGQRANAGPG